MDDDDVSGTGNGERTREEGNRFGGLDQFGEIWGGSCLSGPTWQTHPDASGHPHIRPIYELDMRGVVQSGRIGSVRGGRLGRDSVTGH